MPAKGRRCKPCPSLRILKFSLIMFCVCLSLWTAFATIKVLFPTPGLERRADVIVSLSPGASRLPKALELYRTGISEQIAVSWFPEIIDEAAAVGYSWAPLESETCRDETDPLVHCFTPVKNSTAGEAISISQLAKQYDWQKVTVVTSRYHAFRTMLIFKRYLPRGTDLEVIAAPTDLELNAWIYHIAYENAAIIKAVFEMMQYNDP